MDEQAVAKELVAVAKLLAAADSGLLRALKKADGSWKAYQSYLTKADNPFKKMIQDREALVRAMDDADSSDANMAVAKEVVSTIDSFKDPETFQ